MKKAALWKRHKQKPSVFFAQRFSSSKSSNKLKKIHPSAVSSYPWPSADCGRNSPSELLLPMSSARHQTMDHAQLVITIHHSISRRMNRWCERAGWASTRIPKGLDHGRSFMFFFFACLHKFKNHWILMVPLRFNGFLWHKNREILAGFIRKSRGISDKYLQTHGDPSAHDHTRILDFIGIHDVWSWDELRWAEMSWDELRFKSGHEMQNPEKMEANILTWNASKNVRISWFMLSDHVEHVFTCFYHLWISYLCRHSVTVHYSSISSYVCHKHYIQVTEKHVQPSSPAFWFRTSQHVPWQIDSKLRKRVASPLEIPSSTDRAKHLPRDLLL